MSELGRPWRSRRAATRHLLAVGALMLGLAATPGCGLLDSRSLPGDSSTARPAVSRLETPPEIQSDSMVDLTVYLRRGEGASAHLVPVVREVPVEQDLPRRALELLLEGPTSSDGALEPPLPTSTQVNDLEVSGGVAHVDLSADVIENAREVGTTPVDELLALGAIANTLTEFASIERVELTVDGSATGPAARFWGGWGLPDVLVRDESLVGERLAEGESLADLGLFSTSAQEVGAADAPPVRVSGIRVRDKVTFTRFVLELAPASDVIGGGGDTKIPLVTAGREDGEIVVNVSAVTGLGGPPGERVEEGPLTVDEERFPMARAEHDELTSTLRVLLNPAEPAPFLLHTLANPTRIVLDVKK